MPSSCGGIVDGEHLAFQGELLDRARRGDCRRERGALLVVARVLVTKLTAEVDRLIADNKANEIVSSKVTGPEDRGTKCCIQSVTGKSLGRSYEMVSSGDPILLVHLFVMKWWSFPGCDVDLMGHVLLYG